MKLTTRNIIKELRLATKTLKDIDKEYGTDTSNHVSIVVECILEEHDRRRSED